MKRLTHIAADGRAQMVDVSSKPLSARVAVAKGRIALAKETVALVRKNEIAKGDVIATARIAGIQAAKRTAHLIPLAHPIGLAFVDVVATVDPQEGLVELVSEVSVAAQTGVEMEAMVACAVAALTVYDMVKGIERGVIVEQVVLLEKRGGRSDYRLDSETPAGEPPSPAHSG